ncbi:MAG: hypothetical protein Q9227_006769 [Pyrenula ochraceoflavens]
MECFVPCYGTSDQVDAAMQNTRLTITSRLLQCLLLCLCIVLILSWTYSSSLSHGLSSAYRPTHSAGYIGHDVLLICLSGFGAEFLNSGLTPALDTFISQGFSPPYMIPSFPTISSSNQYTLVTGLRPESHGLVGETFLEPQSQIQFNLKNVDHMSQSKWWTAEPLWVTAEKLGMSTIVHGWSGANATTLHADDTLAGASTAAKTAEGILELLSTQTPQHSDFGTPRFVAVNVPDIDLAASNYGIGSTEFESAMRSVDSMISQLLHGLETRDSNSLDFVIVSDHGLKSTSPDRLIQLDELLDMQQISQIDGWPLRGLHPKNDDDISTIYNQLLTKTLSGTTAAWNVYTRENMPSRFHFRNNARIAPLWIVPKPGWAIVDDAATSSSNFSSSSSSSSSSSASPSNPQKEKTTEKKKTPHLFYPRALSGYDNFDPSMQAIFAAQGPSFPRNEEEDEIFVGASHVIV